MRSRSQTVLRVVIAVTSIGLAVLTAVVGPLGSIASALILVGLTPFAVLDPGSRATAVLVALHGVHWLVSNDTPDRLGEWALTVLVALGLLAIHLAASLASAFPSSTPVPRASLRRWLRRTLVVIGLSLPVWAVMYVQSASPPDGDSVLTYAAVAALAVLALAFRLAHAASAPARPPG